MQGAENASQPDARAPVDAPDTRARDPCLAAMREQASLPGQIGNERERATRGESFGRNTRGCARARVVGRKLFEDEHLPGVINGPRSQPAEKRLPEKKRGLCIGYAAPHIGYDNRPYP